MTRTLASMTRMALRGSSIRFRLVPRCKPFPVCYRLIVRPTTLSTILPKSIRLSSFQLQPHPAQEYSSSTHSHQSHHLLVSPFFHLFRAGLAGLLGGKNVGTPGSPRPNVSIPL